MSAATLPKAWLGLAPGFAIPTVRICMRCPDKAAAEALAESTGSLTTHGYCERCFDLTMAELEELRPIAAAIGHPVSMAEARDFLAGVGRDHLTGRRVK
jgi:hypothetical protein